jgi:hypothetical protein
MRDGADQKLTIKRDTHVTVFVLNSTNQQVKSVLSARSHAFMYRGNERAT